MAGTNGSTARASRSTGPDMIDVARLAGVSPQTVSRTLSGYPHVSTVAREKVLAAVAELGYRRNRVASALASGNSRSIGVVTLGEGSFRFDVATGIIAEAEAAGYTVTMSVTASLDTSDIARAMTRLLEQNVAGIVLALTLADIDDEMEQLLSEVPTIALGGPRQRWTDAIAIASGAPATRRAVDYLLNLGHETVWYVAGEGAPQFADEWRATLTDAGRPVPDLLQGDWSPESGYENGLLLAKIPEATAVFVAGDEMAFGVLRALQESGVRVPEDISVMGADDNRLARYAVPALTTIKFPYDLMGVRAVRFLLHDLENPNEPFSSELVEPEFVIRESTAPPRTRRRNGGRFTLSDSRKA
ncbi:LacI family DNA-binding transcriptional regulator [Microbacterium sp. P5_E9]